MNIAIDFDDTLICFVEHFIDFCNQERGKNYRFDQVEQMNLCTSLDLTHEELVSLFDAFGKSNHAKTIPLIEGAKDVILELAKGNELFVVTGRHRKDDIHPVLDEHFKEIFNDIFLSRTPYSDTNNHHPEKHEHADRLKIDVFIDDDPGYALAIAEKGIPVLMMRRPWNKQVNHPNITFVNDWYEIKHIIDHELNKSN